MKEGVKVLWVIAILSILLIALIYISIQTNISVLSGKITGNFILGNAASCTDTDGGKNVNTYGVVTLISNGQTKIKGDSCLASINPKLLQETYCYKPPFSRRILIGALNYNCPYACSNGTCIKIGPTNNTNSSGKAEYVISGASVSSDYTNTGKTTIKLKIKDKQGFGSNGNILVYDPSYKFSRDNVSISLSSSLESEANFVVTGNPCPGIAFKMLLNDTKTGNREVSYAEPYDVFTVNVFCALRNSQSRCSSIKIQGEYSQLQVINQPYC